MSAWRALSGILFVLAMALVGCERPATPVFECSNGNYRDNPSGSGTCVCVDHRWQCGEGSGAAEAGGTPTRGATEGSTRTEQP